MLTLRSKMVGVKIVDLRTETVFGRVSEIIFDNKYPIIRGITMRRGFFDKVFVIDASEIIELTKEALLVNDEDVIVELPEDNRLYSLASRGFYGIGQNVVTKKGKKIGKVYDILFDPLTMNIAKYYIKSLFSERIIPADSVLEIHAKKIIIRDDFEEVNSPVTATETA